ncbi:MAG TPA: class I SAM-dependent methyltransferase [Rhizomicrobium sp.]|jgi:ubiquinone/menaquinone biosynthesis C-methylase UbiE|nr:class I SAM-dependent methyltransferase [Rhizomicrobium sp.]
MSSKADVAAFWDRASCGEDLYLHGRDISNFAAQARERYRLEPYILPFAEFPAAKGKTVLEIGVGLGADHEQFARAGAELSGIDLTPRAIENTKARFAVTGLQSDLRVGDAEDLPFADGTFDIVYSWGVIHHSPDTAHCLAEIQRVLKPGGVAKIMIYHTPSMIGYMLWLRYAGLTLRWNTTLAQIYDRHLESPGTKAYSKAQAHEMFIAFADVRIATVLTHGDLLSSQAGQRHGAVLMAIARMVWPRALIRALLPSHGLFMLIAARKPER